MSFTVFANDPALQKILTDTRVAVTAQCPSATGIRFYARGDERSSFHGWSSKADKWTIQELLTVSAEPTQPANEKLLREIARICFQERRSRQWGGLHAVLGLH